MKNIYKILIILGILLVSYQVIWLIYSNKTNLTEDTIKNISYEIDGQRVLLKDGVSEIEMPDSVSKTTTRYFGNEVKADFNGDRLEDVAFLLTQNSGGSGTFYYVVVAIKNANGYFGTNGIFIGDRISSQSTEFRNGEIIVNYADRRIDEPMVAHPSIAVSKYFKISGETLIEVLK